MIVCVNKSQMRRSLFAQLYNRANTSTDFGPFVVFTALEQDKEHFKDALIGSGVPYLDLSREMAEVATRFTVTRFAAVKCIK